MHDPDLLMVTSSKYLRQSLPNHVTSKIELALTSSSESGGNRNYRIKYQVLLKRSHQYRKGHP